MPRRSRLILAAAVFALTLASCVPIGIPGLRFIDGQTWSARFEVEVRPGNVTTIRLPVDLALTFSQRLQDITAQATLQYNTGIFRLQSPNLVDLNGRLGVDGHLSLRSNSNALNFDGTFIGDQLVGTVSIAGVVPVGNVTFTRTR